ncbi:MAG: glycosyltransferase family 4 protein [Firmicutes bacterium]|nr:glycosyltransferase family 4 protein [Bacillota bacterium]
MRIAELHWAFPPTIGGVETHLATLGPGLIRRGHEVSLLTGQPGGLPAHDVFEGMSIERCPYLDLNRMTPEAFVREKSRVEDAIHQFLSDVNPDVIHVHNWHYFSEIPLEAVLRWREDHPVALVLTAHNTWHDDLFQKLAEYGDQYDRIIAVSQYTLDDMAEWGYRAEKMRVVHHGVTAEWLNPAVRPQHPRPDVQGRPIIFHPARLSLAKGSLVVVEAFRRVREVIPDAMLLLAGTGPIVDWGSVQHREIEMINDRIRHYGLTEAVDIRPYSWPEIAGVYDAASVVVYPSIFAEPFGIVVIEAMARGRPVVITRTGGMPEIITHEQDGWIVDPNDADQLADALIQLLRHRDWAEALGQRARERVKTSFTAEQMVERTEDVLNQAREVKVSHDQPVAS